MHANAEICALKLSAAITFFLHDQTARLYSGSAQQVSEAHCASCQVPDAKLKYQQLLYLGKKLPPLDPTEHTEDNKVRGCVSQVAITHT